MSECPKELHYSKNHEWVRLEGDGIVTLGVTDHAQAELGDLVFVELPEVGDHFEGGEEAAVVESVKTASDVYSPIAGEVIEVNERLSNDPGVVNQEPYGDGWLIRLRLDDESDLDVMLDAESYEAGIAG